MAITPVLASCKLFLDNSASFIDYGSNAGTIYSESGLHDLPDGENRLTIDISDTLFEDTFTAVPAPGWEFLHWKYSYDENRRSISTLFGGWPDPTVTISTKDFAAFPSLLKLLDSDELFVLAPVFVRSEAITNTVIVGDKEWAQPCMVYVSRYVEIMNSICPNGKCRSGIQGYDLRGWNWATREDVRQLFNYFAGYELLGELEQPHPFVYQQSDTNSAVIPAVESILDAGFEDCYPTNEFTAAEGLVSDGQVSGSIKLAGATIFSSVYTLGVGEKGTGYSAGVGVWLYRDL